MISGDASMDGNKLETMPIPKLVANMSLPLMLSLLVQSLYNIVDGIYVAQLGEDAWTAISLAFPVHILMIAVGVGTGVGVNSLLSRSIGAKDSTMAEKTAATGVVLAVINAAVFMLLGLLFTNAFLSMFLREDQSNQIVEYGRQYILICTTVGIGSFIATMYQRFLQAVGNTTDSMISLVGGAVVNLVLDPVLIFGLWHIPRMEVTGAAVATVVGQCVSAAIAIVLNTVRKNTVQVHLKGLRFEKEIVTRIFQVGFPTIVTQASGSVMLSTVNGILMPFSPAAVAFFGAYYKLQSFVFMPINGLGQAAIPIIGYNYGSKNYPRIREAAKILLIAGMTLALAGTAVFLIFPRQLLSLFNPSEDMLQIGIPGLRIISITFIFTAVTSILGHCISGLGNGTVNMVGTILRQLVLFAPLIWLFADFFGVDRAWYAMWIAESCAAIYTVIAARLAGKRLLEPPSK